MTEVAPGVLIGQNGGGKQTLVDFDTASIALEASAFGREVRLCWHEARKGLRRVEHELLDSDLAGTSRSQDVIKALHVGAQKLLAGFACGFRDLFGSGALAFVAAVGRRKQSGQAC